MSRPVLISRAQIKRNRKTGVDITVKSSKGFARSFAPTWDMVIGIKNGILTEEQYSSKYNDILNGISTEMWTWLADQGKHGKLVVLCYCKDGEFCHTNLLIDYGCKYYSGLFRSSL